MKISDLDKTQIKPGLRIISTKGDPGTIIMVDHLDEDYAWTLWDLRLRDKSYDPTVQGGISWVYDKKYINPDLNVMEDQSLPEDVKKFIETFCKCKCEDCEK
jgi:hypothetical protein